MRFAILVAAKNYAQIDMDKQIHLVNMPIIV